jgi:hypothetical protein
VSKRKRRIEKYDNLRVSSIEWDTITPFIMVIWRMNVSYVQTDERGYEDEIIEMVFPICLS